MTDIERREELDPQAIAGLFDPNQLPPLFNEEKLNKMLAVYRGLGFCQIWRTRDFEYPPVKTVGDLHSSMQPKHLSALNEGNVLIGPAIDNSGRQHQGIGLWQQGEAVA